VKICVILWFAKQIPILYAFLLLSAIFFIFIRREMTYLMYTGMFAILCVFRTFSPLMYPPIPNWTFFIGSVPYWLCLAYLIYKYFDFRKIFSEKTIYETQYEDPYKGEQKRQEHISDMTYRITDSFVEIEDWSKQMPVLLITDKAESGSQRSAIDEFEKEVVPIISKPVKYWNEIEKIRDRDDVIKALKGIPALIDRGNIEKANGIVTDLPKQMTNISKETADIPLKPIKRYIDLAFSATPLILTCIQPHVGVAVSFLNLAIEKIKKEEYDMMIDKVSKLLYNSTRINVVPMMLWMKTDVLEK